MSGPALVVEGLSKAWNGLPAVDGVSFAVAPAEMLALIGPNGAGKSTTFNIIGGQVRPGAGRVLLAGRDVTGASPRALCRLGVGRTFQITETFFSMTVRENVQTALLAYRRAVWRFGRATSAQGRDEAERLLALVGLEAGRDRGRRPGLW